ncbi:MAG: FtsK/SpoIIIE domain-containing protein [Bryobacteraceae bacterium]
MRIKVKLSWPPWECRRKSSSSGAANSGLILGPAGEERVVLLSVSAIREEIRRAAGRSFAGAGAEAGRLFHLTAAEALGGESEAAWHRWFDAGRLEAANAGAAYARALYEHFLGARLTEGRAAFQDDPEALLRLWNGVRNFAAWLTGVLRECRRRGRIEWEGSRGWRGAEELARTEVTLSWRLKRPGWKAAVEVQGTLDALLRDPESGRWAVIEWKLASGSLEADAAQLCLYHRMLEESQCGGAAALVSFDPEPQQMVWDAVQMAEAQQRLEELIGRLAGVAEERKGALAPVPKAPAQARPLKPEHLRLAERAVAVLKERGHDVELDEPVHAGPSYLQVPVRVGVRTRVRRVLAEAHDLQVQLGLRTAPILRKGEGCVLVEIPRQDCETLWFRSVRFREAARMEAPLLVGVDLAGREHFADLADSRTPHLLVAGATGSGKSEWMRSAAAAMLATHLPADLRLVLIDPKRTAFPELRRSPYLWEQLPVLMPPEDDILEAFDTLIEEMERRYQELEEKGLPDLSAWKRGGAGAPPRIVVLCDEYADLVQAAGARKELEARIARLGAKARAAGIHLVLATQRASRDIVTGVLKANLPGRVCLRVVEAIESRLVLGVAGAENLLGRGDLLWSAGGEPLRLQAPLLDEESKAKYLGMLARGAGGGA